MIKNIKKWLVRPYPFPSTNESKLLISLGFGIFVFIFLILFKPFNLNILGDQTLFFSLIYGLITFVILLLNLLFLPKIFTSIFNANKWTIYKMIVFVVEIMLIIGIVNWYFSIYYSEILNHKELSLMFYFLYVFLVGIFPIIFYIFITELIISKKNIAIANTISESKNNSIITNNELIKLKGENKNDELSIKQGKLLYISSEKNYASVFHIEDNTIKESLLRVSLNNLEIQLKDYNHIVRCHKSYIVNTKKVTRIKGNARSLVLVIPEVDITIPVSRNFPKELLFTLMN